MEIKTSTKVSYLAPDSGTADKLFQAIVSAHVSNVQSVSRKGNHFTILLDKIIPFQILPNPEFILAHDNLEERYNQKLALQAQQQALGLGQTYINPEFN